MAQLSNDCFSHSGSLMTLEQALSIVAERTPVVAGCEVVSLDNALGRVVYEETFAKNNLPPFPNSAVDGYAVCYDDLLPGTETELPSSGRIAAGSIQRLKTAGRAVRIFTGAPMPCDADTVFMQEDVEVTDGKVRLPPGLSRGANMRPAGEDIERGLRILSAGQRLRPQDIALAAATGHTHIKVRRRLRVAILSTGNELANLGARLVSGSVYDSNRVMLATLLARAGAEIRDFGIVQDDRNAVADRFASASTGNDLIISSGGVSLGEEDHVKDAVRSSGQLVFWRIAIKPGRPLAMGVINGVPFVGLPGNPAAVYVTFLFFVLPFLAHLGGAQAPRTLALRVRSTFAAKKKKGRREYIRVSVTRAADGILEARKFPKEGAALLTSLTESDGLAEIGDDIEAIAVGDMITYYPHDAFW
jgi:molybdopterin molybdotransferase